MAKEGDVDSNHRGCNLTDPAEPPTTLTNVGACMFMYVAGAGGHFVFTVVVVAGVGCAHWCGVVCCLCWVGVVSGAE